MRILAPMRPPFRRILPMPADVALKRIGDHLESSACPCHGTMARRHVELLICEEQRHFWSPWLSVELRSHQEDDLPPDPAIPPDGCEIRGRFGPHPHVWTMFMFGYAVCIFAMCIGTTWGLSQWAIGDAPEAALVVPVAIVVAVALYVGSQVGQRLGADQIHALEDFLDGALANTTA